MLNRFRSFAVSLFTTRLTLLVGVAAILAAFLLGFRLRPEPAVIEKPVKEVVTVEVPKITTKTITRYIKVPDQKVAKALLEENNKLKLQVEQLSVTLASAQSSGHGTAVVEIPNTTTTPSEPALPVRVTFSDYRLNFQSVGTDVNYTLTQKFSIVNTVSKTASGTPTNLVRLYEIGPGETRTPIPTAETTTIAVVPQSHWYRYPTIQGGLAVMPESSLSVTPLDKGFAIALSWLKKGTSRAPQDTKYALLSPTVIITSQNKARTIGVLIVSYNFGTLKRQPFTNLWLSPFAGLDFGTTITKRFGFVISSSF